MNCKDLLMSTFRRVLTRYYVVHLLKSESHKIWKRTIEQHLQNKQRTNVTKEDNEMTKTPEGKKPTGTKAAAATCVPDA